MTERAARATLYVRSGGVCERCGEARATDAHHRRNRSQLGSWELTNLAHLCHPCHMWITTSPNGAHENGWTVWWHEDPAGVPLRHWLWGPVFLDPDGGFRFAEFGRAPLDTHPRCVYDEIVQPGTTPPGPPPLKGES